MSIDVWPSAVTSDERQVAVRSERPRAAYKRTQRFHAILQKMSASDNNVLAVDHDVRFMRTALDEARAAAERGEVPVGAVVVLNDEIIARAGNRTIGDCDPTAHAEVIALREASKKLGNFRLAGAELYVTIEPCAMCAGAMIQARIARLVYGAEDAKGGAVQSCFAVLDHPQLNHRVAVTSGVLAEDAAAALKDFFAARR
jgi:tRNA(adenine34) deaminase